MQRTAASPDVSGKRERMFGDGTCEGLGSMSLNANFSTVCLFTYFL